MNKTNVIFFLKVSTALFIFHSIDIFFDAFTQKQFTRNLIESVVTAFIITAVKVIWKDRNKEK